MFFIIINALRVSGGPSAHHQEFIKLYVQSWLLSCFSAVYRSCGWVGTVQFGRPDRKKYSVDNNKEHYISCILLVIKIHIVCLRLDLPVPPLLLEIMLVEMYENLAVKKYVCV
jgi:hypothetical protein